MQKLIFENEFQRLDAAEEISVATGECFQNYIVSVFRKRKLKLREWSWREYKAFQVQLLFVDSIPR